MNQIDVQSTPNPNALKFIINRNVKTEGKVTYKSPDECSSNALARVIFDTENVETVHFFENVITVSKNEAGDWEQIVDSVKLTICENIDTHDPNFKTEEEATQAVKKEAQDPDIAKIEAILDKTIRPALQGDGGDLQVMGLEGNVLSVHYEGACGSCPSSTAGTLEAIKGILREEYKPDLEINAV